MPSRKSDPKQDPDKLLTEFEAIGTRWIIELPAIDNSELVLQGIRQRIDNFDHDYSRFRKDSLVTLMSKQAGRYRLPADAQPMMDVYRDLYRQSGGRFTPLIAQTLEQAGYDAQYSLRPRTLTSPPSWEATLHYDFPELILKQPALLDFGAAGKGYLVDIVARYLCEAGITEFLIDAGGDIRSHGSRARIGLEHPDHPDKVIGVVDLQDQALCGSAGNRRVWPGFHHIIDPKKLSSPHHIKAVWAVAPSALIADAMTTALFFMTPKQLLKHYQFDYAIVYEDYSLEYSQDIRAEFFEADR